MDQTRFDQLTTTIGRLNRRQAGGGLLAVLAAGLTGEPATAKKKKRPPCPGGTTRCGKRCVDLQTDPKHCGNCGAACGKGDSCDAGTCTATGLACAKGGNCLVFLAGPDSTMTGNLGGLSGADATCQAKATAAGLPGTYKAWLSSTTTSPSTRFTKNKHSYTLVDGAVIAKSFTDLTRGKLRHPINLDQTGASVPDVYGVWTNTRPNGKMLATDPAKTCADWTTAADGNWAPGTGSAYNQDSWWTFVDDGGERNCAGPYWTLYCFQQTSPD